MKKLFLLFTVVAATILSCSKDDNPTSTGEKKMSLKVTYIGNTANFIETISVQVAGENVESTNVSGLQWDNEQIVRGRTAVIYPRSGSIQSSTVNLETSTPIMAMTVAALYSKVKEDTDGPLGVIFEWYVDGKLVKTDDVAFYGDTAQEAYNVTVGSSGETLR